MTFRDARNWCQVRVFTLEFVEIKSGQVWRPSPWTMTGSAAPLHKQHMSHAAMPRHRERSDVAQQPCRARRQKKPVRQPQRRTLPPPSVAAPVSPAPLRLPDQPPAGGDKRAATAARQRWPGGRGWRPQARGPLQASFVNMLICPVALFAFKPVVSTRSPGASSPRTRPQYPVRPPLTCGGNGPHGRMRRGDDRPDPGKALGGPNKATGQGLRRPQGGQRYPNLRRQIMRR